MKFQSWVRKPQEGDPTLDDLLEVFPEDDPDYKEPDSRSQGTLAWVEAFFLYRAAMKQSKRGCHLKRVVDRVEGWFDLTHLPKESSAKKPFASFDFEQDGVVYRCQFHISQWPWPNEKRTEWDNSRGAKAGLPTLGKRMTNEDDKLRRRSLDGVKRSV